jgi:general secretion pathway protein F
VINFQYTARDAQGQLVEGRLAAEGEPQAARTLIGRGLTPIRLRSEEASSSLSLPQSSRAQAAPKAIDRIALVEELATLLGAGISIAEALPSLALAYATAPWGQALAKVDQAVRSGQSLSQALEASALALPLYVLALVRAGEASGELAAALQDAAQQMNQERQAGQELRNALVYPTVLVLAGVLAVFIIFVGVVPRFAGLLRSSRAEVPELSRLVIEAGLYVQQHLLGFGLAAVALIGLISTVVGHPAARSAALQTAARLPLVGPWLIRVDVGRWATVLAALLANRVPIVQAIHLSAGALRLRRLSADLDRTAADLQRGLSLTEILAQQGWLAPARLNLIRVGERSGELPRMLATLGRIETEAARTLQKRVLALIEPLAILIIGAVIGVIMVAVMMAITSLNNVAT